MVKDFRFEDIGKRMPYTMPEGYMKQLEESVAKEAGIQTQMTTKRKGNIIHALFRSAVAAAAVATLFVVSVKTMRPNEGRNFTDVEKAFDKLSYEDQAYMMDAYNNDAFMAEDNNLDY